MSDHVTLMILFFGLGLSSCSQLPLRTYHYVNLIMNWTDARQYCRAKYDDLATFESMDDIHRLQPTFSYGFAFMGLIDDPHSWRDTMGTDSNSWRWSATGEPSRTGFAAWDEGEPNNHYSNQYCGSMKSSGKWRDNSCQNSRQCVCFSVTSQGKKSYHLISTKRTWKSAQAYCREHHTDLATIEDPEQNNEVLITIPASEEVWIGLYREPWTWSDNTQSSFRFWKRGEPNNVGGSHEFCGSETIDHKWNDYPCFGKIPFICQQVSKLKTVVKMKIKAGTDLTDAASSAQILQQLEENLRKKGMTDFKLRWKSHPGKQKEPEERGETAPQFNYTCY